MRLDFDCRLADVEKRLGIFADFDQNCKHMRQQLKQLEEPVLEFQALALSGLDMQFLESYQTLKTEIQGLQKNIASQAEASSQHAVKIEHLANQTDLAPMVANMSEK